MSGNKEQMRSEAAGGGRQSDNPGDHGSGQRLESLPVNSSPYLKYSDMEDYKQRAYGTEGHIETVERHKGGGGTDAPTLAGSKLSSGQVKAVDAINRSGAP